MEQPNKISILWLPSWYPNRTAPFDGDFIQHMARATALYANVSVICLVEDNSLSQNESATVNKTGNLEETIVYYKKSGWLGRLTGWRRYFRLYKKYIQAYIRHNGLPAYVHVQVPVKAGIVALWMKRKYGVPFVVTEHYGIYNNALPERFTQRSFYFRYFTKRIFKEAAQLLPVSKMLGEAINAMVVAKTFTVIPNTVDTSLFFYKPVRSELFRFIHVSSMIPLKNVQGIIDACKIVYRANPHFEMLLVGPYPQEVFDYARSYELPEQTVRFTGELPYAGVAAQMQQSRSLVLFSNTENMPCVVLEALCCGLPVIATAVGGIPEVVNPRNGLLVPPGDAAALAAAMLQMIDSISSFSGEAIAQQAASLYSYEVIGKKIAACYTR